MPSSDGVDPQQQQHDAVAATDATALQDSQSANTLASLTTTVDTNMNGANGANNTTPTINNLITPTQDTSSPKGIQSQTLFYFKLSLVIIFNMMY